MITQLFKIHSLSLSHSLSHSVTHSVTHSLTLAPVFMKSDPHTDMPWGQFTFYVSHSYSHICHRDDLHLYFIELTSLSIIHTYATGTIYIFISLNLRLSQLFTHMPWGQFTFVFPWTYVSLSYSHICHGDNIHLYFLELTSLSVIHTYAMGTIYICISLNLSLSQLFTHMLWGQFTFLFPWTYVARNYSHICHGDN